MAKAPASPAVEKASGITQVTVRGFKSLVEERAVEIRPLTLLAGANSAGKSSIMQSLLLMKQTFEATYDPGTFLLTGPNVRFTSVEQFLSRTPKAGRTSSFRVAIQEGGASTVVVEYGQAEKGLNVRELQRIDNSRKTVLRPGMTNEEILANIPAEYTRLTHVEQRQFEFVVERRRCFLELTGRLKASGEPALTLPLAYSQERELQRLIHVPGLRGNPERTYPVTSVGPNFPGTFEKYVASVIAQWVEIDKPTLSQLGEHLELLGLTWKVSTTSIDETQVELQVGRLRRAVVGGAYDLVNIADVGFGLSQTLPVVVALLVAAPGQVVYVEQPEIHLHPRAQLAMAGLLATAAKRGVRVVAETHSALLLLGVQGLVADNELPPELVKLHWFSRRADGVTEIKSTDLDETGAFGDWPEDFGAVELEAQNRFLTAVEQRRLPLRTDKK